jgi:general stress protein YciG
MEPRIYTYKVTFEEIPHWYWGVHKEKKFNDGYLGSPITHKYMWELYTPYLQILELFPYSEEGWAEANRVEDRLILPDLNNPFCLNEAVGPKLSIERRKYAGRRRAQLQPREAKREAGKKAKEMKVGIHGRTLEQMREDGINAAAKHKEMGINFYDPEFQREMGRRGGLAVGSKNMTAVNKQKWRCTVTGKISNPGSLTVYQKARGIDTSNRERITDNN